MNSLTFIIKFNLHQELESCLCLIVDNHLVDLHVALQFIRFTLVVLNEEIVFGKLSRLHDQRPWLSSFVIWLAINSRQIAQT